MNVHLLSVRPKSVELLHFSQISKRKVEKISRSNHDDPCTIKVERTREFSGLISADLNQVERGGMFSKSVNKCLSKEVYKHAFVLRYYAYIEQMLFWSGMLTLLTNFECKSLIKSQLQKTYRKQIFRKAEKLPNILSAL